MKIRQRKHLHLVRIMIKNKTAWFVAKLIAPALKRLEKRNGIK